MLNLTSAILYNWWNNLLPPAIYCHWYFNICFIGIIISTRFNFSFPLPRPQSSALLNHDYQYHLNIFLCIITSSIISSVAAVSSNQEPSDPPTFLLSQNCLNHIQCSLRDTKLSDPPPCPLGDPAADCVLLRKAIFPSKLCHQLSGIFEQSL